MHPVVNEHAVGDFDDAERRLFGGARLRYGRRRDAEKREANISPE
jgi:hypothetical protein